MAQNKKVIGMVECAILIALATVLSLIKFVDLPYGGSITVASMLPIALISYRRGLGWGLGSALVYAVIQHQYRIARFRQGGTGSLKSQNSLSA